MLTELQTPTETVTAGSTPTFGPTKPTQPTTVLSVIKRSGKLVAYDPQRIATAIQKAYVAVERAERAPETAQNDLAKSQIETAVSASAETNNPALEPLVAISDRILRIAEQLSTAITTTFLRRWPEGGTLHIETIQDQVELELMRSGEQKVARAYVLYREARMQARQHKVNETERAAAAIRPLHVTLANGATIPLPQAWLETLILQACTGLKDTHPKVILKEVLNNLFEGVKLKDVYKALVMATRPLVELEPNYSIVAARLLLQDLADEVLARLEIPHDLLQHSLKHYYQQGFLQGITQGIELELLDPLLLQFNLNKLAQALLPQRDDQFTLLGLQTLYDRYFLHHHGLRIELPQVFFMRVAMGLAISEAPQARDDRAIEFYLLLSSHDFMSSTPTLFNAGTLRSQLSSCFLTTVPDDLDGIYSAIKDNALLSKYAGGLGNDWTPVRAIGARIKGTNGKSLGVVPFLNVADATAIAVNQGGKRKGAVCAYLETWHMDIEEFLELRKNTGDDRRRTHDMNTANWIPDLFMQRVFEEQLWTLFSPDEVPKLHDAYGLDFARHYLAYEEQAKRGNLRSKQIPAVKLWRKMLGMLFETGHPWMTFKDPCNLRSPQQHVGVVHSSNLCTEITLNTSRDEIAVCNLGSINLLKHLTATGLDVAKLQKTIKTAVRMLDNVIDINYYTVPQARNSNMKHRPIGLGLMGFQDALYHQGIAYASEAALEFADRSMEIISYYAISASVDLAQERGRYASFEGSLWSQGILPIDSIRLLQQARGPYLEQNTQQTQDWDALRKRVQTIGMRNSNVMAIAPTATISNICGVSQSIEPTYQNLYVKSNMSGEFTVVNPFLVHDLKALNLWDNVMVHDLKYYNGSLQSIGRIPDSIKRRYATAFEIEPKWLVEAASRRQKWIDQGQSLNLYMAEPSGKKLDALYKMAWLRGLKTTYYLRSMGATNAEKATIADGALNAVQGGVSSSATVVVTAKTCAIDNPDCEACQ